MRKPLRSAAAHAALPLPCLASHRPALPAPAPPLQHRAGVLYYGDTAGNNLKASQYVTELESAEDLSAFITKQPPSVLTVVDVSLLRWGGVRQVAGRGARHVRTRACAAVLCCAARLLGVV